MIPDTPGINPPFHLCICQDFAAASFIIMRGILQHNFHDTICQALFSTLLGAVTIQFEYVSGIILEQILDKDSRGKSHKKCVTWQVLWTTPQISLFYTKINVTRGGGKLNL